ncbi:MAG: hypothetical protein NTY08_16000 [Proteobacteria bacterium]|nr:hypothetical protein [Pseudomonadota bacterium]
MHSVDGECWGNCNSLRRTMWDYRWITNRSDGHLQVGLYTAIFPSTRLIAIIFLYGKVYIHVSVKIFRCLFRALDLFGKQCSAESVAIGSEF